MKKMLKKTKIIKSKRQPRNLKQMLTRAKFETKDTVTNPSVKKCKDKRCGTCPYIIEGDNFTFENGQYFKVKCDMDCSSKNVIYVIKCSNCNLTYIGQSTYLRARVRVHKQQISDERHCFMNVSKHIAHCSNGNFNIFPFYQVHSKADRKSLDTMESHFISKFKPSLNKK